VASVLREQNTDYTKIEPYSQILGFYPPNTVFHLGPGISGMYLGLITLTFYPGGIEENTTASVTYGPRMTGWEKTSDIHA
jgi:hypothetical protein